MSSSDEESDGHLPPTKTRKLEGAASYKTKFHRDWKKEFDFVTNIPGDPYRFRCNLCNKKIRCDQKARYTRISLS